MASELDRLQSLPWCSGALMDPDFLRRVIDDSDGPYAGIGQHGAFVDRRAPPWRLRAFAWIARHRRSAAY